ncbi:hypothetical protein [Streptomyces sp. NPDC037389]|uniref:hypothetical protein n=1 Tax=Streptomyces sp. NPDC037389 TaxID=3155369 RepID=UPI0033F2EF5C
MGWETEEFGSSHVGTAGAVLADGTEPKPVYIDMGTSGYMPKTTDWPVYDGRFGRPKATHLRASCSCGWRGGPLYPIDWSRVAEDQYNIDIPGVTDDWGQHIEDVKARTVPLPGGVQKLLEQLDEQLTDLAEETPLAALKAAAGLERIAAQAGRTAAHYIRTDETPIDEVAYALGTTEQKANTLLFRYRHPSDD